MSTDEQEKQKVNEVIKRSRKSVGISFRSMLDYVDEVIKSIVPENNTDLPKENQKALEDIKFLLETYREMAETFYAQYEDSLLSEIKKDQKLAEDFPEILQKALEKLQKEWQRLEPIAVRSKELIKDKEFMRVLEVITGVATYSVGLEAERVVVIPSTDFALEFFKYLENFAVLTVPIASVRAPWDWSIFWHELAGYKVRKLKKDMITITNPTNFMASRDDNLQPILFTDIASKLRKIHILFKRSKQEDGLVAIITRNGAFFADALKGSDNVSLLEWRMIFDSRKNIFGQAYLTQVFSRDIGQWDPGDLSGFEYQFERMLEGLSDARKSQIKAGGWCVDWFEELFEDAWSVMAIREPFLKLSEDFLRRKAPEGDHRHPPMKIRLNVGRELLKLMNSGGEVEHQTESSVEERAAKQILKFMSLALAAAYNPNKVAQSIKRYYGPELLSALIGVVAINDWSKFLDGNISEENLNENVKDLNTRMVMEEVTDFISGLVNPVEQEKNQPERSYQLMLKGLDYKQLLDLSFFERDFFSARLITKVKHNKVNGKTFAKIDNTLVNFNQSDCWEGTLGEVTFTYGDKPYSTSKKIWNDKFPSGNYNLG